MRRYFELDWTIIFTIIVVLFIFYKYAKNGCDVKRPLIEGLFSFNGRMATDDQYFMDKLFDDVIYFPNTEESTGWTRCKLVCPSHCLEFGLSGNAYCWPK